MASAPKIINRDEKAMQTDTIKKPVRIDEQNYDKNAETGSTSTEPSTTEVSSVKRSENLEKSPSQDRLERFLNDLHYDSDGQETVLSLNENNLEKPFSKCKNWRCDDKACLHSGRKSGSLRINELASGHYCSKKHEGVIKIREVLRCENCGEIGEDILSKQEYKIKTTKRFQGKLDLCACDWAKKYISVKPHQMVTPQA